MELVAPTLKNLTQVFFNAKQANLVGADHLLQVVFQEASLLEREPRATIVSVDSVVLVVALVNKYYGNFRPT